MGRSALHSDVTLPPFLPWLVEPLVIEFQQLLPMGMVELEWESQALCTHTISSLVSHPPV